jgi:hypothetical protein
LPDARQELSSDFNLAKLLKLIVLSLLPTTLDTIDLDVHPERISSWCLTTLASLEGYLHFTTTLVSRSLSNALGLSIFSLKRQRLILREIARHREYFSKV